MELLDANYSQDSLYIFVQVKYFIYLIYPKNELKIPVRLAVNNLEQFI